MPPDIISPSRPCFRRCDNASRPWIQAHWLQSASPDVKKSGNNLNGAVYKVPWPVTQALLPVRFCTATGRAAFHRQAGSGCVTAASCPLAGPPVTPPLRLSAETTAGRRGRAIARPNRHAMACPSTGGGASRRYVMGWPPRLKHPGRSQPCPGTPTHRGGTAPGAALANCPDSIGNCPNSNGATG